MPARLGLDNVERALGRSSVNVLALTLAVSMSVSAGGWLASLQQTLLDWVDQTGAAELFVTQGSPVMDKRHVPISAALSDKITEVESVSSIQRFRIITQEVAGSRVQLVATDTRVYHEEAGKRGKGWTLIEGQPLQQDTLTDSRSLLISANAAERLGLGLGDTVTIPAPNGQMTFAIRGVVVDYSAEMGAVFIDRKFYLQGWGDDSVDGVFVYLKEGADRDQAASAIRAKLGRGSEMFVTHIDDLRTQMVDTLEKTFSYTQSVELITLLIALLGVVGTMAAAVLDRTREIAVLRAIGATKRQVAAAIVAEAAFIGFCASIIGTGLGLIECQWYLKTLLVSDTGWHMDLVFPWLATGRITGLVVLTSAVAGALPAWRASRVETTSGLVCE